MIKARQRDTKMGLLLDQSEAASRQRSEREKRQVLDNLWEEHHQAERAVSTEAGRKSPSVGGCRAAA